MFITHRNVDIKYILNTYYTSHSTSVILCTKVLSSEKELTGVGRASVVRGRGGLAPLGA